MEFHGIGKDVTGDIVGVFTNEEDGVKTCHITSEANIEEALLNNDGSLSSVQEDFVALNQALEQINEIHAAGKEGDLQEIKDPSDFILEDNEQFNCGVGAGSGPKQQGAFELGMPWMH